MNSIKRKPMKILTAKKLNGIVGTMLAGLVLSGCASIGGAPEVGQSSYDRTSSVYEDRMRRTVYAAVGMGVSRLEPDTSEVPGAEVNDRVNGGGQITIGADLTKHFSLELHSADLGSAGISPTGRINYHLYGGSALIYAGKNRHRFKRRGLSGYGRIGYGLLENSPVGDVNYIKDNATHILFGGGLEYMTRMGLGVRGEVIAYDADVLYGQLGLIYRLGKQRQSRPVQTVSTPTPKVAPVVPPVAAAKVQTQPDPCDQYTGALEGVNFHTNSAELTDSALQILNGVAATLNQCDRPFKVAAHTDSQGSAEYNQGLSERRAKSVSLFLLRSGIDKSRLRAVAFGETQPIDTNETKEGRLRNRRVELIAQ